MLIYEKCVSENICFLNFRFTYGLAKELFNATSKEDLETKVTRVETFR